MLLSYDRSGFNVNFAIESKHGRFWIYTEQSALKHLPDVQAVLRDRAGFSEDDEVLKRIAMRDEIHEELEQLALGLARLP